jgi:hypothetical protein
VRLYSGPAYQPINNYLRQLANLTGEYRKRVAQHAALSFSATVGHLYSAIRKLAAVASAEELAAPLYRGVRGELPRRFWVADLQGLVCATDTAFMSTSRNYHTPVDYMASSGTNVLWVLQPQPETDTAFHRGADIGMLSQFAAEQEVLFPPCTLMVVQPSSLPQKGRPRAGAQGDGVDELPTGGTWVEERGKRYLRIEVLPSFV